MATSRVSKKASKHSKGTKKSSKSMKTKKTMKPKTSKKSKSSKKSMPEGHAMCFKCDKPVKMINPTVKTTTNGRKMLTGELECKHYKGSRFIKS